MEAYSVYKVVGEGSFGRALLVQCRNTEEKYIVKEIQLPKKESAVEEWRREAVLLSSMQHPNIVAFREAFEADGLLCIVMEYCSGGDLLRRIQQQQTRHFCVDDILKWFSEMCAGAKHIHDKRVLHRDLKSKNIFLTDKGTVKLGDFGSACVLNSSKAYACTYVGTPYYVAPEIWENKPYNNKSDVWSLGCVLYELCTLRHPFQAPSWKSLILKVCRGSYPPLPKHLPYELHLLLRQMFKTDPKDRPSLRTILTSHRVSRLLRAHLSPQAVQTEERGQCSAGRPGTDEGKEVLPNLGEKSLMDPVGGLPASVQARHEKAPTPRRRWAAEPSETVLRAFANARLVLSDEEESGRRKQWRRDPPERLLSLLANAEVNRAFSTFVVHREDSPLMGPLSRAQGDATDGPEQEVHVDDDRLQPRSDDEDTDFEEERSCDWMGEVEAVLGV